MRNAKISTAVALALTAFLGSSSLALAAPDDDQAPRISVDTKGEKGEKGEKEIRHRVIVIDKDGERQVFEGDGPNVKLGYLGVGLTDITPELRDHFGVRGENGVLVSKVDDGSPADKAGVKVGDIITSLDGKDIKTSWDVRSFVRKTEDGQRVAIEVSRDGRVQGLNATVILKERPEMDMGPLFVKRGEGGEPILLNLPGMDHGPGGGPGTPHVRVERMGAPGGRLLGGREAELEKRIKELEKRIGDLERQLKK
jgi:membrane-associated protease RseP (regulator of RpoE activity)